MVLIGDKAVVNVVFTAVLFSPERRVLVINKVFIISIYGSAFISIIRGIRRRLRYETGNVDNKWSERI